MNSDKLKVNLHTHTDRCRHAVGSVRDYCLEARKYGLEILGFSDHGPFPDYEYNPDRMFYSDMPDYIGDIEKAQQEFPELTILKGLEIDYRPCLGKAFYEDEYVCRFGLDYLIGGQHYVTAGGKHSAWWLSYINPTPIFFLKEYVEAAVETMSTGLLEYFTHPDLIAMACDRWTPDHRAAMKDIVEAAKDLDLPLEINAYGFRKPYVDTPEGKRQPYPWHPFWEMAAGAGVKVVIGMDAHKPEDVYSNYAEVRAFADEFGFTVCNEAVARKILERKNNGCGK